MGGIYADHAFGGVASTRSQPRAAPALARPWAGAAPPSHVSALGPDSDGNSIQSIQVQSWKASIAIYSNLY